MKNYLSSIKILSAKLDEVKRQTASDNASLNVYTEQKIHVYLSVAHDTLALVRRIRANEEETIANRLSCAVFILDELAPSSECLQYFRTYFQDILDNAKRSSEAEYRSLVSYILGFIFPQEEIDAVVTLLDAISKMQKEREQLCKLTIFNTLKQYAYGLDGLFKAAGQTDVKLHQVSAAMHATLLDLITSQNIESLRTILGDAVDDSTALSTMCELFSDVVNCSNSATADAEINNVLDGNSPIIPSSLDELKTLQAYAPSIHTHLNKFGLDLNDAIVSANLVARSVWNHDMRLIESVQIDMPEFAGRIVRLDPAGLSWFGENLDSFQKTQACYALVQPLDHRLAIPRMKHYVDTSRLDMDLLIPKEKVPCFHAITDDRLKEYKLKMRLATVEELRSMKRTVQSEGATFDYCNNQKTLQYIGEAIFRLEQEQLVHKTAVMPAIPAPSLKTEELPSKQTTRVFSIGDINFFDGVSDSVTVNANQTDYESKTRTGLLL